MGPASETYVQIDQYPSVNGTVTVGVDRSNGHGVYDIDGSRLYLTNYEPEDRSQFTPIRVVNVFDQPTEIVALVEGKTARCAIRYQLISFMKTAGQGGGIYFGRCGQPYHFRNGDSRIAIVEDGPQNPAIQYYSQHVFSSPTREVIEAPPPPAPPGKAPAPGAPVGVTPLTPGEQAAAMLAASYFFHSQAAGASGCPTKAFYDGLAETLFENAIVTGIAAFFDPNGSDPRTEANVENLLSAVTLALAEDRTRAMIIEEVERIYPDQKFAIAMVDNVMTEYATCQTAKVETGRS